MSIVITGANGQLGRLVIADLFATGVAAGAVTAVARSREKAADLVARGVRLHVADYDLPETFAGALRPEDRVLLTAGTDVGRRVAQHTAVIDAARRGRAALRRAGRLYTPTFPGAAAGEPRRCRRPRLVRRRAGGRRRRHQPRRVGRHAGRAVPTHRPADHPDRGHHRGGAGVLSQPAGADPPSAASRREYVIA
jgi:NADPH:quinone reductase-like Zn-dependent oxidoreductase